MRHAEVKKRFEAMQQLSVLVHRDQRIELAN